MDVHPTDRGQLFLSGLPLEPFGATCRIFNLMTWHVCKINNSMNTLALRLGRDTKSSSHKDRLGFAFTGVAWIASTQLPPQSRSQIRAL